MRGLNEMYADDRKEILRAYVKAVRANDTGLVTGLREVHTDMRENFNNIDREQAEALTKEATAV